MGVAEQKQSVEPCSCGAVDIGSREHADNGSVQLVCEWCGLAAPFGADEDRAASAWNSMAVSQRIGRLVNINLPLWDCQIKRRPEGLAVAWRRHAAVGAREIELSMSALHVQGKPLADIQAVIRLSEARKQRAWATISYNSDGTGRLSFRSPKPGVLEADAEELFVEHLEAMQKLRTKDGCLVLDAFQKVPMYIPQDTVVSTGMLDWLTTSRKAAALDKLVVDLSSISANGNSEPDSMADALDTMHQLVYEAWNHMS